MLKQANYINEQLVFEVECLNCRRYSYVSEEGYFSLRKDYEMPRIKPIDNKLPICLDVMVVSMERCAISWIGKEISRTHEDMFGIPIEWHYEVSRLMASRERFPIMKGWSGVYNIDPQILVDKGYDKVLIIQRDLDTLIQVQKLYNHEEIMLNNQEINQHHERVFINNIEKTWNLVYGKEINHRRCLKVRLEDLNNYTVDTFKEVFDFLNFPEHGRPHILPTTPENRNWEAYSSILPKGHELCSRLKRIEKEWKGNV